MRAGYATFRDRQKAAASEGRWIGMGIASYNEDTGLLPFEGALVRVLPTGRTLIRTGASAQGRGLATILAQICADELGVSPADVVVEAGDTEKFR